MEMIEPGLIEVKEFAEQSHEWPVADVRSPSEYRNGHIPAAVNLPLFQDEDRALVGQTFAKEGTVKAMACGMELAAPGIKSIIETAKTIAPQWKISLYCWRGGQRSSAVAWLLRQHGFEVHILKGGYKAYRRYMAAIYERFNIVVLSGFTGSGKTGLLEELKVRGQQVIDLENLACHRGSAFGHLGMEPQPATEQFENNLAEEWIRFDTKKPVWIEDESFAIGKVNLPAALYQAILTAPVVRINSSKTERISRIEGSYGRFQQDQLCDAISRISKRLGSERAMTACRLVRENRIGEAVSIILDYYDKYYLKSMKNRNIIMEIGPYSPDTLTGKTLETLIEYVNERTVNHEKQSYLPGL